MRVLRIGPATVRGLGWLLIGIGLMVAVFAAREVRPWATVSVGVAIAGLGGALLLKARASAQRYRQCPSCARELRADALKCSYCGTWLSFPSD